jgi:hypothetical protein
MGGDSGADFVLCDYDCGVLGANCRGATKGPHCDYLRFSAPY